MWVMGRVYLANAFSLNMLNLPRGVGASICVEELDLERFVERVKLHTQQGDLVCAINNASTAELAEKLLTMPWLGEDVEVRLRCELKRIKLQPGDTLYVIQLKFRPHGGKIYDYNEIVKLLRENELTFYAVYYGLC